MGFLDALQRFRRGEDGTLLFEMRIGNVSFVLTTEALAMWCQQRGIDLPENVTVKAARALRYVNEYRPGDPMPPEEVEEDGCSFEVSPRTLNRQDNAIWRELEALLGLPARTRQDGSPYATTEALRRLAEKFGIPVERLDDLRHRIDVLAMERARVETLKDGFERDLSSIRAELTRLSHVARVDPISRYEVRRALNLLPRLQEEYRANVEKTETAAQPMSFLREWPLSRNHLVEARKTLQRFMTPWSDLFARWREVTRARTRPPPKLVRDTCRSLTMAYMEPDVWRGIDLKGGRGTGIKAAKALKWG